MRYWRGPLCRRRRCAGEIAFAIEPRAVHGAMAVHAPAHAQIFDLAHALHAFDRPVTFLASHTSIHMWTVIEVNKIR